MPVSYLCVLPVSQTSVLINFIMHTYQVLKEYLLRAQSFHYLPSMLFCVLQWRSPVCAGVGGVTVPLVGRQRRAEGGGV